MSVSIEKIPIVATAHRLRNSHIGASLHATTVIARARVIEQTCPKVLRQSVLTRTRTLNCGVVVDVTTDRAVLCAAALCVASNVFRAIVQRRGIVFNVPG